VYNFNITKEAVGIALNGLNRLVKANSLSPMKMAESYCALFRASWRHSRRYTSMMAKDLTQEINQQILDRNLRISQEKASSVIVQEEIDTVNDRSSDACQRTGPNYSGQ
jgi:hypothetical protein